MLKQIAETLSPLYGIPIAGNTVVDHPGKIRVETPTPMPLGDKLHDLTGYSKKMLLPYLERKDIHWNIKGDGWVVYQFPPPGTPITSGMNIYVELK
jgi:cell division protein FtsI (penicillin-binding protein 3)